MYKHVGASIYNKVWYKSVHSVGYFCKEIFVHEQRNKKLGTPKSRIFCGVQQQVIILSTLAVETARTVYGNG
jgi:hypothetical protein